MLEKITLKDPFVSDFLEKIKIVRPYETLRETIAVTAIFVLMAKGNLHIAGS